MILPDRNMLMLHPINPFHMHPDGPSRHRPSAVWVGVEQIIEPLQTPDTPPSRRQLFGEEAKWKMPYYAADEPPGAPRFIFRPEINPTRG